MATTRVNSTAMDMGRPRWAMVSPEATIDSSRFLMPSGAVRWVPTETELPYADGLRMAGYRSRFCLYYLVEEDGTYLVRKHCVYPFLAGGHAQTYDEDARLYIEGTPATERLCYLDVKGSATFVAWAEGCRIERTFYPAVQSVGLVERISVYNGTDRSLDVRLELPVVATLCTKGVSAPLSSGVSLADEQGKMLTDLDESAFRTAAADATVVYYVVYWSKVRAEDLMVDCRLECKKRAEQIDDAFDNTLVLCTPEPMLNRAFAHALLLGAEHLADTPAGVMPLARDMTVADACRMAPIMGYCGLHRARQALDNVLSLSAPDARLAVPAAWDDLGHPVGTTDAVSYASALAHHALTADTPDGTAAHYKVVEQVVEDVRRHFKNELYAHGKATFGTQCEVYALLERAARLALATDHAERAKAWQEVAKGLRRRINTVYGAVVDGFETYRTQGGKLCADVADALAVGIDERAEGTAHALVSEVLFDGLAHLAHCRKSRDKKDADVLNAAYGLAHVGYADAAWALLHAYTTVSLYDYASPYPVDRWCVGGSQSPLEGWRYCRTVLGCLLDVEPLSFDRMALRLHLPREWRHFEVRGLHIAGYVLNLQWQHDCLSIQDIFGRVLYTGAAARGQRIEVELPH